MNSIKKLIIILILLFSMNSIAFTEDTKNTADKINIDVKMGLAIQKYLEGDLRNTITTLNDILAVQPDNSRAISLMKKTVKRLAEATKVDKKYATNLPFLEMGVRYVGDSADIIKLVDEIRKIGKDAPDGGSPAAKPSTAVTAKKPRTRTVVSGVSSKKLNQMNRYLKKIEKGINSVSSKDGVLSAQFNELEKTIIDINQKIVEIDTNSKKYSINFWIIILLSFLIIASVAVLYLTVKTDNLNVIKNILRERKAVEEMKVAYNKDTAELAKKLTAYGKSQQRAGELERNWEKIINILTKLTEGGSIHKVVLKDAPDGRKAVTGVDPRTRARADSVEVISDIFRDTPKAAEMLLPFLDDIDNRTRANAAVAYYRYDPEKALVVIQEMAVSKDKWMRLSAAWALGELADSATSGILEKLLDDPDSQVKNKARLSLEKILGNTS